MQKTFDKKKFLSQNSIWLVLIVLVIIMSIVQPSFFTINNLLTLLSGEAVKGIMAFGVMFAILSKGIDLTIGASAALVACILSLIHIFPSHLPFFSSKRQGAELAGRNADPFGKRIGEAGLRPITYLKGNGLNR